MNPQEFLQAELEHAQRQLTRIRRIATRMQTDLESAGLDEVAVYEKLAGHKAYRQLQRDEAVFQQMWLRCHRHLQRLTAAEAKAGIPLDQAIAGLNFVAAQAAHGAKPQPFRKPPTPGRNAPCPCGSTVKYKRCCGNPLRQAA